MPKKLTPLHYVLVSGKSTGYYRGPFSRQAIKARLRKERCGGNRHAAMYRLLRLNCTPDGVEVWGTYQNVECPDDIQHFSWS